MTADTCPNACGRCHRCAEEITRLREDISRYVSRDTERLAEVEKLREALKPFGSVHPSFAGVEDILWGHLPDDEPAKLTVKLRDLRRARAVLTGIEAPQSHEVTSEATCAAEEPSGRLR